VKPREGPPAYFLPNSVFRFLFSVFVYSSFLMFISSLTRLFHFPPFPFILPFVIPRFVPTSFPSSLLLLLSGLLFPFLNFAFVFLSLVPSLLISPFFPLLFVIPFPSFHYLSICYIPFDFIPLFFPPLNLFFSYFLFLLFIHFFLFTLFNFPFVFSHLFIPFCLFSFLIFLLLYFSFLRSYFCLFFSFFSLFISRSFLLVLFIYFSLSAMFPSVIQYHFPLIHPVLAPCSLYFSSLFLFISVI
jgi:hypothetical protein